MPPEYRDQLIERDKFRVTPSMKVEAQRLQQQGQLEVQVRRIDELLKRATSPIDFRDNQIVVPVRVARGNRTLELKLLLDTGANRTVFHRQALTGLNTTERSIGGARTASGDTIPLYQTQLDRLEIGPFVISPAPVQMLDYQGNSVHQGLLGMDLLSQVQYEVDYERQTLYWAPEHVAQLRIDRQVLLDQIAALDADSSPVVTDPGQTLPKKAPYAISVDGKVQ